jgi:membrane protein required for colicin V production
MNGADYLIIVVLVASMLLGLVRGFVREAIAVLAWLCGIWLGWRYAPLIEPALGGMLDKPPASTWVSRAIIVVAVLLIGWLISSILGYFLRHSGLSVMIDRLLGMLFGFVRGGVVVAVFVLLAQLVALDQTGWWREARLLPYAVEVSGWISAFADTGRQVLEEATASGKSSARI